MEKEPIFTPEESMSEREQLKRDMIAEAMEKYKNIFPTQSKTSLNECFTAESGKLLFWFNTEDESTHVITRNIKN
jgi:hypothetical protein